jgi:nucleoside-diphosphate-sugar epimerase
MAEELIVVVTGSTGKQGGAVARGLLERGHKVRAVTRDPNSSQAKLLANAGATLVAASLEDTAAIMKALEGATSLFAMTTPSGGTDAETRQGAAPDMSFDHEGIKPQRSSDNSRRGSFGFCRMTGTG